jgi:predicted ribosome quality control (RQC) complex YloA/Tae2 family protein
MKTETVFLSNIHMEMTYNIGVSAQDNFDLIDASNPQDIWFHVEGLPSCHVVAVIPENEKLEKKKMQTIIKRGALICKQNSKYVSHKNLPIIYTKISNVQKTNILGSVTTTDTKIISI